MKHCLVALACLVSSSARAVEPAGLRTGDILLQPLNCYLCNAIEALEGSVYSHSGLVVREASGSIRILESIGGAGMVSLAEFMRRTQKNQAIRLVRPREFEVRPPSASAFVRLYHERFEPVVFDGAMRWDNRGEDGREPLYCSEFVAKFLARFLRQPYPTKTMRFSVLPEFWRDFFNGDVPEGEPGLAPSDFLKSSLSHDLGDLEGTRGG
jgi:hypothetical protein